MSIDVLQDKVRKLKNPSVIELPAAPELVPPAFLGEEPVAVRACGQYYKELLSALKGMVPAVRFGFSDYALHGADGFEVLVELLRYARQLGFYVLVDAPEALSPVSAERAAAALCTDRYPSNGLIVPAYLGSDALHPFVRCGKTTDRDVFAVVRTSNKSAPEIQDLLTGARHVHTAAVDIVSRLGEGSVGKFGYSAVGAMVAAGAPDSLRSIRAKYGKMFLIIDGYDYPNGNAKNCSYAFDKLGHGAVACAGASVVGAWKLDTCEGADCIDKAVEAAARMKKNLNRYLTIL